MLVRTYSPGNIDGGIGGGPRAQRLRQRFIAARGDYKRETCKGAFEGMKTMVVIMVMV